MGPTTSISDFLGPKQGLKSCISYKFLGHADAAGLELYVEKHRYKMLYKKVHKAGVAQRERRLLEIRVVSGI